MPKALLHENHMPVALLAWDHQGILSPLVVHCLDGVLQDLSSFILQKLSRGNYGPKLLHFECLLNGVSWTLKKLSLCAF
jgi:hypothetical protein